MPIVLLAAPHELLTDKENLLLECASEALILNNSFPIFSRIDELGIRFFVSLLHLQVRRLKSIVLLSFSASAKYA